MILFKEHDGSFSWRKILTGIGGFLFAFSVIGYEFGMPEIPASYQAIIAGIFAFYFFKNTVGNMRIGSNNGN